uniref:Radial spoke head 3 n=1 Tax=Gouania willdenowi TaxID=441366 RepID=A0A8C5G5J0_GOUWI
MAWLLLSQSEMNSLFSRQKALEERSKYRVGQSENRRPKNGNIMVDRRVVRGNTYSQHFRPATVQPHPPEIKRQQPPEKKEVNVRRRAKEKQVQHATPGPEPVQVRKHMDTQTDLYLEELACVIVTTDMACQTDAFLDRPASPLFIPVKSGIDVGTQIEEGDLFDFDLEVEPMVEVLVGKTMEQALLEVMEEEELASLRAQQRKIQVLRDMELAEVQRLQEQERRRCEERERRITQQREALMIEEETVEKIAARAYTQQSLADLLPTVFNSLRKDGYFPDPVERDIETNYMPWQMEEVHKNLDTRNRARQLLDQIILDVHAFFSHMR